MEKISGILIPFEILEDQEITLAEKLIYSYINAFNMNRRPCFASVETIAKRTGIAEPTVKRGIRKLITKDYLVRIQNAKGTELWIKMIPEDQNDRIKMIQKDQSDLLRDQIDPERDQNDPHNNNIIIKNNKKNNIPEVKLPVCNITNKFYNKHEYENKIKELIESGASENEIEEFKQKARVQLDKYNNIYLSEVQKEYIKKELEAANLGQESLSKMLTSWNNWAEENKHKKIYKDKKQHHLCICDWPLEKEIKRNRDLLDLERSRNYFEKSLDFKGR